MKLRLANFFAGKSFFLSLRCNAKFVKKKICIILCRIIRSILSKQNQNTFIESNKVKTKVGHFVHIAQAKRQLGNQSSTLTVRVQSIVTGGTSRRRNKRQQWLSNQRRPLSVPEEKTDSISVPPPTRLCLVGRYVGQSRRLDHLHHVF